MVVWGLLTGVTSALGYIIGFLFGFAALALLEPEYRRRAWYGISYVVWLLGQIALSAWQVATAILTPGRKFTPGIVAVPIRSIRRAEIILLASSITLTPGTISVETGFDKHGGRVIFVHSLLLQDADGLRDSIRDDMERRLLRFMRSTAAKQPSGSSQAAMPGGQP
jgi:multicomponent Na+:H+ antiporter subunit E